MTWPERGSVAERGRFAEMQSRLPGLFERVFPNPHEERTVVVIPGIALDRELLAKIEGVQYYEE